MFQIEGIIVVELEEEKDLIEGLDDRPDWDISKRSGFLIKIVIYIYMFLIRNNFLLKK